MNGIDTEKKKKRKKCNSMSALVIYFAVIKHHDQCTLKEDSLFCLAVLGHKSLFIVVVRHDTRS